MASGGRGDVEADAGRRWIDAYNRAPIWRFWLGADFCGEAMIGAFMPSVDGVGRAFPLCHFRGRGGRVASAARNSSRTTPGSRRPRPFFSSALEPGATLELIAEKVTALPAPALQPRTIKDARFGRTGRRRRPRPRHRRRGFRRLSSPSRRFGRRRAFASQTFWWTIGGEGFPSLALSEVGLPPATLFVDMLTGAFSDGNAIAWATRPDRRSPAGCRNLRMAYDSS